jgi:hypothetical protein
MQQQQRKSYISVGKYSYIVSIHQVTYCESAKKQTKTRTCNNKSLYCECFATINLAKHELSSITNFSLSLQVSTVLSPSQLDGRMDEWMDGDHHQIQTVQD